LYEKHVEYIGRALDCCRATDNYPDDSQFRWINEISWPVTLFLQQCPDRAEELATRMREGRMELCGLYLDPTELYDQRSFRESLRPALELAQHHDLDITTAMTIDIPGQGWGLVDVLADHGIRYLSVAPNSMVSRPLQVERPFYWVGPGGGRVLVWMTDWRKGWYGEGHVLGFTHGFEAMRSSVMEYVDLLAGEGYQWRALALHMAADNYPPLPELSDLVRSWNESPGAPRMRISTNREFFDRMVELHDESFPVYRAAWPDWWSEGLGSAAYETGLSRETHCRLQRIEGLQKATGRHEDLWPIFDDLMLFDEHTWGAQSMALRPHSFDSRASWTLKSQHIYRACHAARRLEAELAAGSARRDAGTEDFRDATVREAEPGAQRVTLTNPLDDDYIGPVALPSVASDAASLRFSDGRVVPLQRSAATDLAEAAAWAVVDLPAGAVASATTSQDDVDPGSAPVADSLKLSNEFYQIEFDPSGRVVAITDLETGRELLDASAPWGFGETVHEHIVGQQDREAVWERGGTEIPYGTRRTDAPFRREGSLAQAEFAGAQAGPVFASVTWRSSLPHVRRVETELRLWRGLKRIDVEVRLDKQPCETYESLYVAFPFELDSPRAFIHSCGATFEADKEQLPGSCRDFYHVEHFAGFEGDQGWALLCPTEAPLVQLGDITFGRWADELPLAGARFYSWLTNNFWYTNFPGYQMGHLRFRFTLTTGSGALEPEVAERIGRQARVGIVVA
ncbi:MAG TPA: glycoside hydrolase family 38 C-terminal domain-containing protein, partial [Armatimonadota bacterium]|nr:glycoside hydrolase family 38 C-terminal domain-containing protein [Armatimonadota bacterium]